MSKEPEEPKGAVFRTKYENGTQEEILFKLSDKHPVNPGGVGYWSSFTPKDKKKKA